MKTIKMKDASGKVRWKSAHRRSAYEAAGWIAVEDAVPSKNKETKTKTVVVDEPVTLKMTEELSVKTEEENKE
jgi:hypothetical protein